MNQIYIHLLPTYNAVLYFCLQESYRNISLYCDSFYCTLHILHFYKWKFCGNPVWSTIASIFLAIVFLIKTYFLDLVLLYT